MLLLTVVCEKATQLAIAAPTKSKRWLVAPLPSAEKLAPWGLRAKEEPVYTSVEQWPIYSAGDAKLNGDIKLNKDLKLTLRYPRAAAAAELIGTVMVGAIVEKDGSLSDVHVAKGLLVPVSQAAAAQALHTEAIRAVQALPDHWQPGKHQGRPVRTVVSIPVGFNLQLYLSAR